MNSTSRGCRLVRMAARSPARCDHRTGGGAEADAELARDDLRQRGLAEAGRAVEQHVVQRLAAAARRLDEDGEVFAQRLLADELGERQRTQGLDGVLLGANRR